MKKLLLIPVLIFLSVNLHAQVLSIDFTESCIGLSKEEVKKKFEDKFFYFMTKEDIKAYDPTYPDDMIETKDGKRKIYMFRKYKSYGIVYVTVLFNNPDYSKVGSISWNDHIRSAYGYQKQLNSSNYVYEKDEYNSQFYNSDDKKYSLMIVIDKRNNELRFSHQEKL